MITQEQIKILAKKYKTHESNILREYFQLLFLKHLYQFPKSSKVFFKGGTAIHLIYKVSRFSEDLDFTVELNKKVFLKLIDGIFKKIQKEEPIEFKERKIITGKKYLLTVSPSIINYKIFINLDFSFREEIYKPEKSLITTEYPIIFNTYIYHL